MTSPIIIINPSQWLILGGIFACLALFTPKRIPLSICLSALLTSGLTFVFLIMKNHDLQIFWQLFSFFMFLAISIFFIRIKEPEGTPSLAPDDVIILKKPIKKGKSTHKHEGTTYTLVGPDSPSQSRMTVVSMSGLTAYVQPSKKE